MSTSGVRRGFSVLVVMALALWMIPPIPTMADTPTTETSDQWFAGGFDWEGQVGWSLSWDEHSVWGSYGDVWVDDWAVDPPIVGHGSFSSFDPTGVEVEITWFESGTGEVPGDVPLGTTSFGAVLTLVGAPETFEMSNTSSTNHKWTTTGTQQAVSAVAEVVLLDGSLLVLPSEDGGRIESVTTGNNPRSWVDHYEYSLIRCSFIDGGFEYMLFAGDHPGEGRLFWSLEVYEDNPEWTPPLMWGYVQTSERSMFQKQTLDIPMWDGETGETVGAAKVSVKSSPAGVDDGVEPTQYSTYRTKIHLYELSGQVDYPTGFGFDLSQAECTAHKVTAHYQAPGSEGPSQRGPIPTNDRPSGAKPLRPDTPVNDHTRMAAFDPEEPMWVDDYEWGPEQVPGAHTLWYTFEGTGSQVLVTTDGSDFDTVAGVYVKEGDSFTQLAGRDNHLLFDSDYQTGRPLQAKVTLETQETQTYYIQVGSPAFCQPEYGRLRIEVIEIRPIN